jgi:hypothetical protein
MLCSSESRQRLCPFRRLLAPSTKRSAMTNAAHGPHHVTTRLLRAPINCCASVYNASISCSCQAASRIGVIDEELVVFVLALLSADLSPRP